MCTIIVRKWDELKSTVASEMMRGKFPDCGAKFTSKYGQGLVLVKYGVPIGIVKDKAKAAGINSHTAHVFVIPRAIAAAVGV